MVMLFMNLNIQMECFSLLPVNRILSVAVVSFWFVPETRGLDLQQLENIYRKKKPQVI